MRKGKRDRGNANIVSIRLDGFDSKIIVEDGKTIKNWKEICEELTVQCPKLRALALEQYKTAKLLSNRVVKSPPKEQNPEHDNPREETAFADLLPEDPSSTDWIWGNDNIF